MTPDPRPPSARRRAPGEPRPPADRSAEGAVARLANAADVADPADAAARSAELVSRIRAEIESSPDRRITFARYMERALYEPDLGYYRGAADRPTDAGDFLTAPETHAIFGWTVARRLESMWDELGRPRPFDVIEYGAGSGTLALSILDGIRRHGSTGGSVGGSVGGSIGGSAGGSTGESAGLLAAVRYEPIESNPYRLADLRDGFEKAGLGGRLATSSPTESAGPTASVGSVPVTGVILANEFLDALPVHRFVVRGGKLLELYVAWKDGFVEVAAESSTPALAERLAEDGIDVGQLAEGQVGEISLGLGEWLREVAARLARGYVLIIDYGYEAPELYGPRHLAGTLLGYRGHRVEENPFAAPGETDLTAHVDFTAVAQLAAGHGLRTLPLTTQSEFLVAAGLEDELRALQAAPDLEPADYLRARSGIVRMLDPRHMGRFRVLTLERDASAGAPATPAR
jgi:SAM-dependent MidA family methyltransferase